MLPRSRSWQILGAEFCDPHTSIHLTQTLAIHGAAPFFLNCLACHGALATYILQLAVHVFTIRDRGVAVLTCIWIRCCVGRQLGQKQPCKLCSRPGPSEQHVGDSSNGVV